MSKAMSLKAKIRNIAKQKIIPAQVILQNYMFERLLVRLSVSRYKEKFVLKGGMLVAAIVGLDNRATMDLDATLKKMPLTPEAIGSALEEICNIAFEDDIVFEIGTISPIREDDLYGGYRVGVLRGHGLGAHRTGWSGRRFHRHGIRRNHQSCHVRFRCSKPDAVRIHHFIHFSHKKAERNRTI